LKYLIYSTNLFKIYCGKSWSDWISLEIQFPSYISTKILSSLDFLWTDVIFMWHYLLLISYYCLSNLYCILFIVFEILPLVRNWYFKVNKFEFSFVYYIRTTFDSGGKWANNMKIIWCSKLRLETTGPSEIDFGFFLLK